MKKPKLLIKIKNIIHCIFGSRIDEIYWRFRHIADKSWAKSYVTEESINQSHRSFLIDKIFQHYPFESILEVGCASGPNIFILARKFPDIKIYGLDISRKAIEEGKRFLKEKGVKNAVLENKKFEDLDSFGDEGVDIIFSDASLIYLDRINLESFLEKALQTAKKAIILLEWHSDSNDSFFDGHWVHNYNKILDKLAPGKIIKITKIPENSWSGDWLKYGHTIEITL
jgi:SAM-dependent methyltransferase